MAQEALRIDPDRQVALERVARRRGVSIREVLLEAVDEYLERTEDEELLERSAQVAEQQPSGLRNKLLARGSCTQPFS